MNNPETLDKIIEGCVKGKRICQKIIYEKYYGRLLAVCLRYARHEDEAKDVLQDGFIKIYKNINKYNFKGSFEGWMRRIIVNTAIDYYRKNKREPLSFEEDPTIKHKEKSDEEFDSGIYGDVKREDILKAVQKLSPACRTVFNLYAIEGYTHKEIAEILNINIGTSKSNLSKAKDKLRVLLKHLITTYSH